MAWDIFGKRHEHLLPAGLWWRPGGWTAEWSRWPSRPSRTGCCRRSSSAESRSPPSWSRCTAWTCQTCSWRLRDIFWVGLLGACASGLTGRPHGSKIQQYCHTPEKNRVAELRIFLSKENSSVRIREKKKKGVITSDRELYCKRYEMCTSVLYCPLVATAHTPEAAA